VLLRGNITAFLLCLSASFLLGQNTVQVEYSLDDCLLFSLEVDNSLELQQIKFSLNALDIKSSSLGMYTPNVSASITENLNFSNSIDPLTFNFIAQNTNATLGSIDVAWDVFNGFQKQNAHKGLLTDRSVFELEEDLLEREIAIVTTQSYFAVLASKISLDLVDTALNQSLADINQYDLLIEAGLQPAASRVEFEVNLTEQELQQTRANAQLNRSKLSLAQLLQQNNQARFTLDTLGIFSIIRDSSIYLSQQGAEKTRLLGELRLTAENYRYRSVKGLLWPTISLGARINTNFFSASQQIDGFSGQDDFPIIGVTASGETVVSTIPFTQPIYSSRPFVNQLKTNFSQSANLTISFPLWGRYQRFQAIQQQQLAQEQLTLSSANDLREDENRLASYIQDARGALETYHQTKRLYDINAKASRVAQTRYEGGLISPYELSLVRNRQQLARVQFYQARLDLASKLHLIRVFYEYSN
jgi:outer membrane protein TolC